MGWMREQDQLWLCDEPLSAQSHTHIYTHIYIHIFTHTCNAVMLDNAAETVPVMLL